MTVMLDELPATVVLIVANEAKGLLLSPKFGKKFQINPNFLYNCNTFHLSTLN